MIVSILTKCGAWDLGANLANATGGERAQIIRLTSILISKTIGCAIDEAQKRRAANTLQHPAGGCQEFVGYPHGTSVVGFLIGCWAALAINTTAQDAGISNVPQRRSCRSRQLRWLAELPGLPQGGIRTLVEVESRLGRTIDFPTTRQHRFRPSPLVQPRLTKNGDASQ